MNNAQVFGAAVGRALAERIDRDSVNSSLFVSASETDARANMQAFFDHLIAVGRPGYIAPGHYHMSRGLTLANANGVVLNFAPGVIFDYDQPSVAGNGWNINECSNLRITNPPEMRMNRSIVGSGSQAVVIRNPNPGAGAPNGTIVVEGTWKVSDWGSCCFLVYHGSSWPTGTDTGGNVYIEAVDARGVMDPRGGPTGGIASFANNGFLMGGLTNCWVGWIYISNVWDNYAGSGPAYALQVKGVNTTSCGFISWKAENCLFALASGLEDGGIGATNCRWGDGSVVNCPSLFISSTGTDHQIGAVQVNNSIDVPGSTFVRLSGNTHRCNIGPINARGLSSSTLTPLVYISGDENVVHFGSLGITGPRMPYVEFAGACDRNAVIVDLDVNDSNTSFPNLTGRVTDNSSRKNNQVIVPFGNTNTPWRNGAAGPKMLQERYGALLPFPTKSANLGGRSNRFGTAYLSLLDIESVTASLAPDPVKSEGCYARIADDGPANTCQAVGGVWRKVRPTQTFNIAVAGRTIASPGETLSLTVAGVLTYEDILSVTCPGGLPTGVAIGNSRLSADGTLAVQLVNATGAGAAISDFTIRAVFTAAAYHPYATTVIARFTTPPSEYVKQWINRTVIDLVSANIWSKLDVLRFDCLHDAQASTRNWIKSSHHASVGSATVHTPYVGFTGDGTVNGDLDWNYNPSTEAVQFTINSASYGSYVAGPDTVVGGYIVGQISSTGGRMLRLRPRFSGNRFQAQLNSTTVSEFTDITSAIGLAAVVRESDTIIRGYVNGVEIGVDEANVATTLPPSDLSSLRDVSTGTITTEAGAFAGGALTDEEMAALSGAFSRFVAAMAAHP